jgi:subtilisin
MQMLNGAGRAKVSATLSFWSVAAAAVCIAVAVSSPATAAGLPARPAAGVLFLDPPQLLSPSAGAKNVSTTATFNWTAVTDATVYWLNIALDEDSLPTNPAAASCPGCVVSCVTFQTTHTLGTGCQSGFDPALVAGTKYYWSVQGYSATVNGEYSNSRGFTVKVAPEILVSPTEISLSRSDSGQAAAQASSAADVLRDERTISSDTVSRLLQKAGDQGYIRVIARVAAGGFVAEGKLDASAVRSQRATIAASQDAILAALGGRAASAKRFETIPFVALELDRDSLARLIAMPEVLGVQEDSLRRASLASSVPSIGTPAAWAAGLTGAGKTVAILDTGVEKAHPFFSGTGAKVVSEACYSTNGFGAFSLCPGSVTSSVAVGSGEPCSVTEECVHGTHVAGISSGNDGVGPDIGVAKDSSVISVQVFSGFTGSNCSGAGADPCVATFDSDYIKGLERVFQLRNEFDIASVNMSFGGGSFAGTCDVSDSAVKAAIDNLRSVGIASVVAAGNEYSRGSLSAPACVSSAISVGATTDAGVVASFSNVSPLLSLLAPGVDIVSSIPPSTVASFGGTSMAAPHVAGAWAILKEQNPGASVSEILEILRSTATLVSDTRTGGTVSGMRLIELNRAILEAPEENQFAIINEGSAALSVTSIVPDADAPWLTTDPATPFSVPPGTQQLVTVNVDFDAAPERVSTRRLLVSSNDADESPYPNGVFVELENVQCGDGFLDEGEDCDDGDTVFKPGQFCSSTCDRVRCGQPTNSSGDTPTATDARFILTVAVGSFTCDARVCDVDGNHEVTATDSRDDLRAAVGQSIQLDCPGWVEEQALSGSPIAGDGPP